MTDLLKVDSGDEDLEGSINEEELKILRDSKILKETSRSPGVKRKHILFAETSDEGIVACQIHFISHLLISITAIHLSEKGKGKEVVTEPVTPSQQTEEDLGWKTTITKKKTKKSSFGAEADKTSAAELSEKTRQDSLDKRKRLLKELSARLDRDRKLRYAEREFEMQRQLMGKGGRKKIQGVEKVEGEHDEEENEDEIDARRGKKRAPIRQIDEDSYKPRVYKWRLERKR